MDLQEASVTRVARALTWRRASALAAMTGCAGVLLAMTPAAPAEAFPEVPNFCNGWSTGASGVVVASSFRRFTFTSDGTFTTPNTTAMPVRLFMVGGGGGGGAGGLNAGGGGGGAGAVLEYLEAGTSLEPNTTYTITIGQGGSGSTSITQRGGSGTSSIVAGGSQYFEATGGGGGASGDASVGTGANGTVYPGMYAGSSGGGGAGYDTVTHAGGTGAAGDSFAGGNGGLGQAGSAAQLNRRNGGGGGGSNPSNGGNGTTGGAGGGGGSGESNGDSTGTSISYASGGGGGGRSSGGSGSGGGGGAGGVGSGFGTDANTTGGTAGGGGGGGGNNAAAGLTEGGDGARGTVVIAHRINYSCPSTAPSGTPGITGTIAGGNAVLSWNAPGGFATPQAVASFTVVYYLPGGTSSGNIYAKGGPVSPRTINISGDTEAECEALNPLWDCAESLGLAGEADVTFKTFARTTVNGVGKMTAASAAVTYPEDP